MLVEYCSDYVLFDLETTGLSSDTDYIVEISAIKIEHGNIIDEYSSLVNPGVHIPYSASSVNGITDDMVKDSPNIEHALNEFRVFTGDNILVGHNIKNFDLKFIQRDALQIWGRAFPNDFVDTLIVARRYLPELESHSLEALSYHYNISYDGAHRALVDCHINKQVYDYLANEIANPSEAAKKIKICPRCGNILKKRNSVYGDFWGCASYPECKYTLSC